MPMRRKPQSKFVPVYPFAVPTIVSQVSVPSHIRRLRRIQLERFGFPEKGLRQVCADDCGVDNRTVSTIEGAAQMGIGIAIGTNTGTSDQDAAPQKGRRAGSCDLRDSIIDQLPTFQYYEMRTEQL